MNRMFRPTPFAALGASLFAASIVAMGATPAQANVEIGGTAGVHVFSDTNELGVADVANANSQRNSALFGFRVGAFFGDMFGVEGELGIVPSEPRRLVFDVWNLTYRAHVVAQFRANNPATKLVPFVLVGAGAFSVVDSQNTDVIMEDTDELIYAGVGAKYRVDNGWGLRADARVLFPPSSEDDGFTTDFELLLSIYKEFGRKTIEKVIEAPPPDLDPDKDGIVGDADQCPQEPEDMDSFQDDDGCPDLDNDQDGIADAADKCPLEPEDKDGFEDDDGCPDPDNDGDGVPDAQDKCAADPETKNGFQDEDGCPDEIPAKLKAFTGVIQGINFKVSSAQLQPASNRMLDKAVAVLKEFGDLRVEIQGHTDDQVLKANKEFKDNLGLSQARAESVRKYFIDKGIDGNRLSAVGFGDTQPIEPPAGLKGGKLNAARAKNRRVEFKLISNLTSSSAVPTPVGTPTPSTNTQTPEGAQPTPQPTPTPTPTPEPTPAPAPAPTPTPTPNP